MRISKHLGQRPEVTSSTLVTAAGPKIAAGKPVDGITLSDRQLGENARSAADMRGRLPLGDCHLGAQIWVSGVGH
jgi:hypothetical protein